MRSFQGNLNESQTIPFADRVVNQIHECGAKLVRIHVSGDFYSKSYVRTWERIARLCPDTRFLAYTRRRDLSPLLEELNSLPNVKIFQSIDPSSPDVWSKDLSVSLIEGTPYSGQAYVCPTGCPECGYKCWDKQENIAVSFKPH
jgi:hypothetical protein